jgi:GNAT superfamily N-acetyltransferase
MVRKDARVGTSKQEPTLREIAEVDVPALFLVRIVTHENRLTREELAALGITEESVRVRLRGSFKGWLCEQDQRVVGFAIGDRSTGELWVIAVLPEWIGRGIGSALLRRGEEWLRESGCARLWLTTDIDQRLRAYAFYRQHGWADDRIENGMRYMVKSAGATRPWGQPQR